MAQKVLSGAGLRGQSAGETELCTVGLTGTGLTYRGYDISDLAAGATFEEVAHLILYGELPNQAELDAYKAKLKGLRGLPQALREVLERIPADTHPMDVMRTGCSMLGNLEPEGDFSNQSDVADRLLACLPSMLLYWHRFHADGVRINTETDDDSISGHFLHMLHDEQPKELHRKSLDTTLILYAEHEFNASTFTARVVASTESDPVSAVVAAIGSLKGPLHGGAPGPVLDMLDGIGSPAHAEAWIRAELDAGRRIMGLGHRIYRVRDPRAAVLVRVVTDLEAVGAESRYLALARSVEKVAVGVLA